MALSDRLKPASEPLVNRGAEALVALLNGRRADARRQLRLLTLSELASLEGAASWLADEARSVRRAAAGLPKDPDA